ETLRAHFKPEFLNRIDEIIFFHALARDHMKKIIDIQITGLVRRLEERKIHVQLTDSAKEHLVREGYDPAYGARPLKRAIQRLVLDPLALRVLEGEFMDGDTIVVDERAGAIHFEKREPVRAEDGTRGASRAGRAGRAGEPGRAGRTDWEVIRLFSTR